MTTDTYSQYYTELCNHAANTANVCSCSQGPKVPPLIIPYVNAPGPGQTIAEWHMQQSPNIPYFRHDGGDVSELSEQEQAMYSQQQQAQLAQQLVQWEQQQAQLQAAAQQQQYAAAYQQQGLAHAQSAHGKPVAMHPFPQAQYGAAASSSQDQPMH